MSEYEEIPVPAWLQAMLKEGDEISFRFVFDPKGRAEWFLNGEPVSDPSASPTLPSG